MCAFSFGFYVWLPATILGLLYIVAGILYLISNKQCLRLLVCTSCISCVVMILYGIVDFSGSLGFAFLEFYDAKDARRWVELNKVCYT